MKFVFIAGLLPWSVLQAEISKTGYKKSYCRLCLLYLLWHLEHWARLSDIVKYVGLLDYWAIDFLTPSTTGQNRLDSRRTALIWQCCMWPLEILEVKATVCLMPSYLYKLIAHVLGITWGQCLKDQKKGMINVICQNIHVPLMFHDKYMYHTISW